MLKFKRDVELVHYENFNKLKKLKECYHNLTDSDFEKLELILSDIKLSAESINSLSVFEEVVVHRKF